ncbi:hypothetical protein EDB80DRAFT_675285 [Ilyonectria destructans]|nr:hypothetical protein EDB80DRAFT_675285 [Ilyonectria destructans]
MAHQPPKLTVCAPQAVQFSCACPSAARPGAGDRTIPVSRHGLSGQLQRAPSTRGSNQPGAPVEVTYAMSPPSGRFQIPPLAVEANHSGSRLPESRPAVEVDDSGSRSPSSHQSQPQ